MKSGVDVMPLVTNENSAFTPTLNNMKASEPQRRGVIVIMPLRMLLCASNLT
jgi:hypothetical protein